MAKLDNRVDIFPGQLVINSVGNNQEINATILISGPKSNTMKWAAFFEGHTPEVQQLFDMASLNDTIHKVRIRDADGPASRGANLMFPQGVSLDQFPREPNRSQIGIVKQMEGYFLVRFIIDVKDERHSFMLGYTGKMPEGAQGGRWGTIVTTRKASSWTKPGPTFRL